MSSAFSRAKSRTISASTRVTIVRAVWRLFARQPKPSIGLPSRSLRSGPGLRQEPGSCGASPLTMPRRPARASLTLSFGGTRPQRGQTGRSCLRPCGCGFQCTRARIESPSMARCSGRRLLVNRKRPPALVTGTRTLRVCFFRSEPEPYTTVTGTSISKSAGTPL